MEGLTGRPLVGISSADRHGHARWLREYAGEFGVLHLGWPAQHIPSRHDLAPWAEAVPDGFRFDISAPDLLCGASVPRHALPADLATLAPQAARIRMFDLPGETRYAVWERFRLALESIRAGGKLGAVIFRLPRVTRPGPATDAALSLLSERLPHDPLCVELPSAWSRIQNAPGPQRLTAMGLGVVVPGEQPRTRVVTLPSGEQHVIVDGPRTAALARAYRLLTASPAQVPAPAPWHAGHQ
jgi:uncharacterized protein YecE (DUF72 family)